MKLPQHLFVGCHGDLIDTRKDQPVRSNYSYHHKTIENVADLKATLRAGQYAFPGGYPLYFITADGGALSFESVRENLREVMEAIRDNYHDGWFVVACDVNYEDGDLTCSYSGKPIESAYGLDNDTPNLDDMDVDELREFLCTCRINCLYDYAKMRIRAMEHRLKGHIQAAMHWEAELEKIL